MKTLFYFLLFTLSFVLTANAQTPKPVNQLPPDSVIYITNDQVILNKYYGPGRYQLSKCTAKQFYSNDSLHQQKEYYGQDSIRMTINRDTIKTTQADSLNSLVFLTAQGQSASLYVGNIHTGQYFIVKSTAWTKGNLFNWRILNKQR